MFFPVMMIKYSDKNSRKGDCVCCTSQFQFPSTEARSSESGELEAADSITSTVRGQQCMHARWCAACFPSFIKSKICCPEVKVRMDLPTSINVTNKI